METEVNTAAIIYSAIEQSLSFPKLEVSEASSSTSVNSPHTTVMCPLVRVPRSEILIPDDAYLPLRKRLRRKLKYVQSTGKVIDNYTCSPIVKFFGEKSVLVLGDLPPRFRREMTTIPEEGFQYKKPSKHHCCFKAKATKEKVESLKVVVNRLKQMWLTKPEVLQESIPEDVLENFKAIQI